MLNDSQRRDIARDLKRLAEGHNGRVLHEEAGAIGTRHRAAAQEVRALAESLGVAITGPTFREGPAPAAAPEVKRAVPGRRPRHGGPSPMVRARIREGRIFRLLRRPEEGESLDDMWALTTVGQLKAERAAIEAWVAALARAAGIDVEEALAGLPQPDEAAR